jgi:hypothetical protein
LLAVLANYPAHHLEIVERTFRGLLECAAEKDVADSPNNHLGGDFSKSRLSQVAESTLNLLGFDEGLSDVQDYPNDPDTLANWLFMKWSLFAQQEAAFAMSVDASNVWIGPPGRMKRGESAPPLVPHTQFWKPPHPALKLPSTGNGNGHRGTANSDTGSTVRSNSEGDRARMPRSQTSSSDPGPGPSPVMGRCQPESMDTGALNPLDCALDWQDYMPLDRRLYTLYRNSDGHGHTRFEAILLELAPLLGGDGPDTELKAFSSLPQIHDFCKKIEHRTLREVVNMRAGHSSNRPAKGVPILASAFLSLHYPSPLQCCAIMGAIHHGFFASLANIDR